MTLGALFGPSVGVLARKLWSIQRSNRGFEDEITVFRSWNDSLIVCSPKSPGANHLDDPCHRYKLGGSCHVVGLLRRLVRTVA